MAAKESSAEDFNPRHRILGAVILVAAAVIFVPVLLKKSEPPDELKGDVVASPADAAQAPNRVVVSPVTGPTAVIKPPAVEPPAVKPAPAPPGKSVTSKVESPAEPTTNKVEPAGRSPAAPAAVPEKGWVVQVGTFTHKDNATRLSAQLKQHGHHVLSEDISLEGRAAVRLRVGPFGDKGAALKAHARIERELSVKGVVLTYP